MIKSDIYDFKVLRLGEISQNENLIQALIDRELDGFIIENFLTEEDVISIKYGYENLNEQDKVTINSAFNSYPVSFAQLEQYVQSGKLTESDYFKVSNQFTNTFHQKFGINLERKFKALYSQISDKEYQLAYYKEKGNHFVPYNFRELKCPGGNLKSHCEQYFMNEFPSFYRRLKAITDHHAQLSFFIVLSNPTKGGELTLFDALWPNFKKRIGDHIIIEEATGKKYDLDNGQIESMSLKPIIGSLVVFSGGHIWHRVEGIEMPPERLTLGGFISFSFDKKIMYTWS